MHDLSAPTLGHGPAPRAALVALLVTAAVAAVVGVVYRRPSAPRSSRSARQPRRRGPHSAPSRPATLQAGPHAIPNIVFVLTDDLSMDLLPYMPQVQAAPGRRDDVQQLLRLGLAVLPVALLDLHRRASRTTPGCSPTPAPSAASRAFYNHGDENRTFNIALQRRRLPHGDDGQVPQRLPPGPAGARRSPSTARPPGWIGVGRRRLGLPRVRLQAQHRTAPSTTSATRPRDYLTDVLARRGVQFIDRSAAMGKPFFLELATFAPHSPYVPAPRDAHLSRA